MPDGQELGQLSPEEHFPYIHLWSYPQGRCSCRERIWWRSLRVGVRKRKQMNHWTNSDWWATITYHTERLRNLKRTPRLFTHLSSWCTGSTDNVGFLDFLEWRACGAKLPLTAECGESSPYWETCRHSGGGNHGEYEWNEDVQSRAKGIGSSEINKGQERGRGGRM